MDMPKLQFEYYHYNMDPATTIMIDGSGPIPKQLSHWPGTTTPKQYWADSSTAICLRFLREANVAEELAGITHVTNNHYDEDGCLGMLVLLQPERALEYADLLQRCAYTGDFSWYEGEDAAKLSLTITYMFDHARSPHRSQSRKLSEWAHRNFCYLEFFRECEQGLLGDLDRYDQLWKGELAYIQRGIDVVNSDQAEIIAMPELDLGVLISQKPLHRIAYSTALRDFERQLVIIRERPNRQPFATLSYNTRSFFATTPWFGTLRPDMSPLMQEWNRMENDSQSDDPSWSGPRWQAASQAIPTPRMRLKDGDSRTRRTSISVDAMIESTCAFLKQAQAT